MAKVQVLDSGCWAWTGALTEKGYGTFWSGGYYDEARQSPKMVRAHRWSYEHFVGPIPEGKIIDHKCHTKRCVNPHPKHLQPTTHRGNQENRKGASKSSKSGHIGVRWRSAERKWEAAIQSGGSKHYLGRFDNLDHAIAARQQGEATYFTTRKESS